MFVSAATSGFDLGIGFWHMTTLAVESAVARPVASLAQEKWVFWVPAALVEAECGR